MRGASWSAFTAVCALFATASAAIGGLPDTARARTIATIGVAHSPALAGERLLWTESGARGVVLWTAAPGEVARRVQVFRPRSTYAAGPALAASPSLTILSQFGFQDFGELEGTRPAYVDHYRGPPGEPLDRFVSCPGEEAAFRSVDVSGQAYAYRQCDDQGGHVEIRDEAAVPMSPPRSVGSEAFGVRIAGRYVAWLDGALYTLRETDNDSDIVVYDRVADAEVYRLPPTEVPGRVHGLDVQDDGKIAIAFRTERNGVGLGWASPDEPYLHLLPLPARRGYGVRMADDEIAFQTGASRDSFIQHAKVAITDLAGNVRVVARRTEAAEFLESFDYDGERFVWREFGCEERRLVVWDAGAPGMARGGGKQCPLRLLRRPRVRRAATVLRIGCGAFVTPCRFGVTLRARRDGTRVGHVIWRKNPVKVPLNRRARRLIRERGSLRVEAEVRLFDAGHRRQTRHGAIRLRRP